MDKDNACKVYDEGYAQGYNQDFLLGDLYKPITDFEQETIKKLLDEVGEKATWLDVTCGTGYFLSLFPTVQRVGLDISPAMLKIAKQANLNASNCTMLTLAQTTA